MDNVYTNTTSGQMAAPGDWDHSQVSISPLFVTNGSINGHKVFATYWKPTNEEIEQLVLGGVIEVLCLGAQTPMQLQVMAIPEVEDAVLVNPTVETPQ